jgi:glycerol-3-phosphate acyltransferase PlsY
MTSKIIILPLFAFLLGSVPWGVILTRLFSDTDVRKAGSGNIGAYNVYRLAGRRLGVMTLAGDLLKGAVPVLAAVCLVEVSGWKGELWICLVALSAFAGHLYPIFLGFKGGKGVATAAGCFLIISPLAFLVCVLVYLLGLCSTGYSSAGSLCAAVVLPIAIWFATHSLIMTCCAIVITFFIFARHTDNMKRLLEGTEHSSLRP